MKKITYDIEWELQSSHWWFQGRRRLLRFLLSSLNMRKDSFLIDVGCGVGSNLHFLRSLNVKTIGIDSEIHSLLLAQKRLLGVPLVHGDMTKLPFKSNSIGLIIASDVLEHLTNDSLGVREIYRTLQPKGVAIFTVPAFEFLKGTQDRVGMHSRRYSKKQFLNTIQREGFTILKSSYFNFILFPPIFLARRFISLLGLNIESENKINFPLINFVLTGLFSLEPYILKYFSFPFGVSIYSIAEK
jgi:ubiquinone/menaquinone biosynthesis C-methylase UbiE